MPAPLTPQAIVYGFTPAADPQVSPDGTMIVYALSRTDAETKALSSQLWLCAVDGSGKRQLTFAGERNGQPRWSPDGSSIAFVSDREKPNGVYVLPMSGGEPRKLLTHPEAVGDLEWSPDSRRLAFTAPFDPANPEATPRKPGAARAVRVTSRIDYKQDMRGYLGDRRTQVYVVDAATGDSRRLSSETVDHGGPRWSPDGTRLLVRTVHDNGMSGRLWIIPVDGGEGRAITERDNRVSTWSWSPSGDRIIFTADPGFTSQTDFYVYDVATQRTRQLTDDLQCLPDGGFPPILPPSHPAWIDDHTAMFHAFERGASGIFTIDTTTGAVTRIEGEPELRVGFSVDAAARTVVQVVTGLDVVSDVSVVQRGNGGRAFATDYSAAVFAASPAARWERFDVTRGGYTTEAWLLLPPDFDAAKRYPLVIDIHGGPNGHYGYGFNAIQQVLATNGIPVVFANPRGSSSYGRDFTTQVYGDWGGEDFHDLMAVVDRALERPYFDKARTGIWGYSYGGYMTAWTIAQTNRFKAAVCGAPCFDLESMYGTSDISHFFGVKQWSGRPWEAREWYATHSPSQFAHNTRTPTLIVHGEADERCPIGQGEQMFVTLKAAGCEVEFARYPGQGHSFLRVGPPEHREDLLGRVLGWFKGHLGGAE